ncbi:VanZ family protein [Agromyces sp. NPDC055520]
MTRAHQQTTTDAPADAIGVHRSGIRSTDRLGRFGLVGYLALLVWIVLWRLEAPHLGDVGFPRDLKLVPFVSTSTAGSSAPAEVVANVLLFIPFGLFLRLLAPSWPWWKVAGAAAGVSLALECAQYAAALGVADVSDLIANTAGSLVGLAVFALARRRLRDSTTVVMTRICAVGVVVLLLAAAAFAASPLHYPPMRPASHGLSGDALIRSMGSDGSDSTFGAADGFIEEGESVSPFADELPAISGLEPGLRAAMQDAARAAIADGYEFVVTNGWRSAAYQQSLLDAAVIEYGSLEEARRFVSSPETSKHVTGEAVDIGRTDANSWLSQHGSDYGLCQTYANEMWHFELATEPGGECPAQLSDASAGW